VDWQFRRLMSFCRWSDDDFQCDIYAYESEMGFEVHVAANRVVGPVPHLPNILKVSNKEFSDALKKQLEYLRNAERRKIGLRYDGQSFSFDTIQEMLEKLEQLKSVGYNVPERVLENIRTEIEESHGSN
jgi:hypothetical protein